MTGEAANLNVCVSWNALIKRRKGTWSLTNQSVPVYASLLILQTYNFYSTASKCPENNRHSTRWKIASHLGHTSTDNEELRFTRGFHPFMAKLTDFIFHRILIFLILWVFFGLLTPNLKQVAIPYTPSPHPSHSSMSRKTITVYLLYACAIIILTIWAKVNQRCISYRVCPQ